MAINSIAKKDVRVAPGADNAAVVRSYQKRLRTRKSFRELSLRMNARASTGVGEAHAVLGLADQPHSPPYWWSISVGELDDILGPDVFPATSADRRLGLPARHDPASVAVVVPTYDQIGRVSGLWAAAGCAERGGRVDVDWRWRGLHDFPGGVGLLHSASSQVPAWGGCGLIWSDPGPALRLHADRRRHASDRPPAVILPPHHALDIASISRTLPARKWVALVDKSIDAHSAAVFKLCSSVSAMVRLLPDDKPKLWTTTSAGVELVARAASWQDRIGDLISGFQPGHRLASFLVELGWNSDLEARCFPRWTAETRAKVADSLGATERVRSVPIRKGLTIVEADGLWVWEEKNIVVSDVILDQVRSYLDANGAKRHKGLILHKGLVHQFDTNRFREDPSAAVETALLEAGVADPPSFHPCLSGLVADIVMHFNKIRNSAE